MGIYSVESSSGG